MTTETSAMTTVKWGVDPVHSEVGFKVRHLMITNVKGAFKKYSADIETGADEDLTKSKIEFTVDAASVDTGNEQRDTHIKGADFFNVEKNPEIKFVKTRSEKVDETTYHVFGNLTMRGVTKEVRLNVELTGIMKDPWGNHKAGVIVNGKINRKDWGLVWNTPLEAGGMMLGDDVHIICELQLVKQS